MLVFTKIRNGMPRYISEISILGNANLECPSQVTRCFIVLVCSTARMSCTVADLPRKEQRESLQEFLWQAIHPDMRGHGWNPNPSCSALSGTKRTGSSWSSRMTQYLPLMVSGDRTAVKACVLSLRKHKKACKLGKDPTANAERQLAMLCMDLKQHIMKFLLPPSWLWNCIGSELVFRLEFGFSC